MWTRGFGSWGSTSGDGNAARVNQSIGSVFVGADTPVFGNWRAGVFGGYDHSTFDIRHSTFDVSDRMSSGSSDDYHLGVYGGSQWGSLEPFANLAYVNLHVDGFSEQGNAASLSGNGDTVNMAYSTLGARASTAIALGNVTLVTSGSLGWRHAYGNSTPTSVLALRGSMPFSVAGVPVTRDSAVVTAGVGTALTRNLSAHVSYSGQFGGGFQNQGVFGDLTWRF